MKVTIELERYDVLSTDSYTTSSTVEDSSNNHSLESMVQLCEQALKGLGFNFNSLEVTDDSD